MKLIYISLYLLLLSNVLSNKLLVNNRNQEVKTFNIKIRHSLISETKQPTN